MNKTILGVIAAIVVAGGIYWYVDSQKDSPSGRQESSNETGDAARTSENADSSDNRQTSLAALAQSDRPQKCTFSTVTDGFTVTGTSYMDGQGKYRVDYSSRDSSQTYTGHNIFDANATIYMWQDGQAQGFKYDVQSSATAQQAAGLDPNVQTDYDCESWSVDNAMFVPPSSVTFTSFADLMGGQR
jgi:hypothetical protein